MRAGDDSLCLQGHLLWRCHGCRSESGHEMDRMAEQSSVHKRFKLQMEEALEKKVGAKNAGI